MHNFATVVLTSDRQHYDMVDIDKVTISDILSKSSLIRDSYKLCHIKVTKPKENIWKDKKDWFESRGFEVILTNGNWKNDDLSHGRGLIEDMAKIYNYPELLKREYVLHLEGDWTFETPNLDNYLSQNLSILSSNPEIIYSRCTRADQYDIIERLAAKKVGNYYITNKEFSFNPFMSRARDMRYVSNFVLKNNIHSHCEKSYELAAKYLLNNENIFSFTHNGIVRHLGGIESKEEYEKKLKELK